MGDEMRNGLQRGSEKLKYKDVSFNKKWEAVMFLNVRAKLIVVRCWLTMKSVEGVSMLNGDFSLNVMLE